jgi:tyrosine-protein phosphatase SIW14
MKSLYLGHLAALAAIFVPSGLSAAEAQLQAPGIPNFHQVNDRIFRGAQPTDQGWDSLAKLGVKVVVDLRRDREDGDHFIAAEAKAVEAAGMRYVNIPMNGIVAPRDADIRKALEILNGPDPVFVHCKLGKDRTGTVVACYRISHDRWNNGQAMDEARNIGLHRIEVGMKRYISSYQSVGTTTVAALAP